MRSNAIADAKTAHPTPLRSQGECFGFLGRLAPPQEVSPLKVMWPIVRINWERSRFIYDLFYKKESISRQLSDRATSESCG